jgi:hypothetical protein
MTADLGKHVAGNCFTVRDVLSCHFPDRLKKSWRTFVRIGGVTAEIHVHV